MYVTYKDPAHALQETQFVSIRKTSWWK